jgi:Ion channel
VPRERRLRWGDASLTALLAAQCLTTFVAIPIAAAHAGGRSLLDVSHLVFAGVCAVALTRNHAVRAALLAGLVMVGAGPAGWERIGTRLGLGTETPHEMIAVVAFGFNLLVTVLVARRAFGPGRVSAHRVQGAVLVYLNVAALFAIAYSLIEAHAPGAIRSATSGMIVAAPGARTAELSYFSLSTITTVGYGDFLPVDPLARSLANLEAVFGQLFPATFLARLVALHLAHTGQVEPDVADARQPRAEDAAE